MTHEGSPRRWAPRRPWLVLAVMLVPAIWHLVDFEGDTDPEYPRVIRPTFSAYPPAAYRLAEPGDTIDRIGLYLASGVTALAAGGWVLTRRRGEPAHLWPAATAVGLAATWYASTPAPCQDGWHGLGWQAILDSSAPRALRIALIAAGAGLAAVVGVSVKSCWPRRVTLWREARRRGILGLLVMSAGLLTARQLPLSGLGPEGYWPRWAFAAGLLALVLALFRVMPPLPNPRRERLAWWAGVLAGTVALVTVGLWTVWYQRPLGRFKEAVPGRIFISAMPTYEGLSVAHRRHGFKTIINLFPEHTDQRSPHFPDELRFVREHGIRYVLSPEDPDESDAFLDRTLQLAQDPDAWPILVHCHGCMDRTPAWLGMYRFLVEERPLVEALREIERHRGYRPKASVTLLYNHALRKRAPGRYDADPTGRRLLANAAGSPNPYEAEQDGGRTRTGRRVSGLASGQGSPNALNR